MNLKNKFYFEALRRDRKVRAMTEDANSAFYMAWDESYDWLLRKKNELYNLPHDSPIKLKVDALIGILEKVKIEPDADPAVISSNIDVLTSELNAVDADEEPGEFKEFMHRTIDAFRSASYNANAETGREVSGGGFGGGGPFAAMDGIDDEQDGADGAEPDSGESGPEAEPEEDEEEQLTRELGL
jgi:hypothetical protein